MKTCLSRALLITELVVAIVMTTWSGTAFGASGGLCGDSVMWEFNNGVLTISGSGPMSDTDVLNQPWRSFRGSIRGIVINDGVTSIGAAAFDLCKGLRDVIIPDSVTSIGDFAFTNCIELTEVIIPSKVISIGKSVFSDCTALRNISLPNGVKIIDRSAFNGCSSLQEIVIPNSVRSIGQWAFDGCSSLKKVTLSANLTRLDSAAFQDCKALKEITIPDGLKEIETDTFRGCILLERITIPESVTKIWSRAFLDCISLTDVYYSGSSGDWSYIFITSDNDWLKSANKHFARGLCGESGMTWTLKQNGMLTITGSGMMYDFSSPPWGTDVTAVMIDDGVTNIGAFVFCQCNKLTRINIPSSIKNIGVSAFSGCRKLTEINYTGTKAQWNTIVIRPNNESFSSATVYFNWEIPMDIILPASLRSIPSEAFVGIPARTGVYIPASVTSIADGAFSEGTIIVTPEGSYAAQWADENGIVCYTK